MTPSRTRRAAAAAPPRGPSEVAVERLPLERFERLMGDEFNEVRAATVRAGVVLDGRTVWNVNSTALGGGVAELLMSLLAYARGAGVSARWMVISGDEQFFSMTKRVHNRLHGFPGDGGPLGERERAAYERMIAGNAAVLTQMIGPNDAVILHDPQTAGLIPFMKQLGVPVVWRCHVGVDEPNELSRQAWRLLEPYVTQADATVFSRRAFAWDILDPEKLVIIPPTIDAFSPKNEELEEDAVDAILHTAGLRVDEGATGRPMFRRISGRVGTVRQRVEMFEERPLRADEPYVLQVSRWDALKDPAGVIRGFAEYVSACSDRHHLIYAGPATAAVSDDPEGMRVLAETHRQWSRLPQALRERIHLAQLPMTDPQENAATVNALQRRADVVIQKSLAEGFGLTVAEAMWKARPVTASRLGGIQDQIEDGHSGLLLKDPGDLAEFGGAVCRLVGDPDGSRAMGLAARERVREHFLGPRSLIAYMALLARLLEGDD